MLEKDGFRPAAAMAVDDATRSILDSAHEAFISMDADGLIAGWNPQAEIVFGWTREEAVGRVLADTIIPTRHRDGHWAGLRRFLDTGEGPVLDKRLEIDALHRNGREFPVEITITAGRTKDGWAFHAFLHDISERRRADEESALIRQLAIAIGEASTVEVALALTLGEICERTGWLAGEAWIVSADGSRLECSPAWYTRARDLEQFRRRSEEFTFPPGVGLPGKAWAVRRPIWSRDVSGNARLPRAELAREAGLSGAMAVPVLAEDEVAAVLVFLVREAREEDERLVELVSAVATQLGTLVQRKRAQEGLRRSEERYRLLAENSTDVISVVDLNGILRYVSPSCRALVGYEPQELVGRSGYEFVHPEDKGLVAEAHRGLLDRTSPLISPPYRVRRKDGSHVWIESTVRPIRDPERGEIAEVQSSARDVTKRREAELSLQRSEKQLAQAQKLAHIGSWEWDIEADDVTWSDELFRIVGLERQKLGFDGFLERVHPDDRQMIRDLVASCLENHEPLSYECRVIRPDGEERALEAYGEVELNAGGSPVKLRGTAQDISERKRAEDELRGAHEQLELRTRELERSNTELEQFAYDASHDLGEPLRIMSQVAERLALQYGERLDDEAKAMIGSLVDGAERAQMLISDLLEYSRAAREPPKRSDVDCAAVVGEALELLEETIMQKEATITSDELPMIKAHPTQLAQLFRNLLSNALKFSADEPLLVHVGAKRAGDLWHFYVRDNGIGVDPRQADRIFELFRRLHPQDVYAGTGMGLSICKRIVERHGGQIWFEPAEGGGSVFHFTVPDSTEGSQSVPPRRSGPS